ncbi:MAG: 3-dehydroquinate synthase [Candidatus Cyclobacteriaceae bacterium M3_2C_046]
MLPSYIAISEKVGDEIKRFLGKKDYSKISVLVDYNTLEHCYPRIQLQLPDHYLIKIDAGEEFKNLSTCEHIWNEMTLAGLDRNSLLINLGGGVIGDMGGFCAATYKRGIDFVNIPTTLLAQVDASIGGKLGIDFKMFKNHIGVFSEPALVIVDPLFLKTLPNKELRSGFAEIIKHCLIADQIYWYKLIENDFLSQSWNQLIPHSIGVKHLVVKNDPLENGYRKILNFGHTIGHAIESYYLTNGQKLLHGEAIAIGMIAEAYLSTQKSSLSSEEAEEIKKYILTIFDKVDIPFEAWNEIVSLTLQDKKNAKGIVRMALLKKTGECGYDFEVDQLDIIEAIKYYLA